LGDLDDALEKMHIKVNDMLFLDQCKTFKDDNGRVKQTRSAAGHHGDLVMAWGIAWQVRKSKQAILSTIFV